MCYPFCIWNTNTLKKVHPIMKKRPSKKIKFFGFRFRKSLVENKKNNL